MAPFGPPASAPAPTLKSEGDTLFKLGEFVAAADKYSKAIAVEETAILYANRAQCYLSLEK